MKTHFVRFAEPDDRPRYLFTFNPAHTTTLATTAIHRHGYDPQYVEIGAVRIPNQDIITALTLTFHHFPTSLSRECREVMGLGPTVEECLNEDDFA